MSFDINDWQLTWTRNLNIWHQVLSHKGYRKYSKLWGMKVEPVILCITEDVTHTSIFFKKDKYPQYVAACMDLVSTRAKQKALMRRAHIHAKNLDAAMALLEKKPSASTWEQSMDAYARFCIPLPITGFVGRVGEKQLAHMLRLQGVPDQEIPVWLGALIYPSVHTPTVQSRIDLLKICLGKKSSERKLLKQWMAKHQHIPVGFNDEPWTLEDAREQLEFLRKDAHIHLQSIKNTHQRMIRRRKSLMKQISPSARVLADAIALMTELNEFRKNVISEASLRFRPCMSLIASKAGGTSWRDVLSLLPDETVQVLAGENLDLPSIVHKRRVFGYTNLVGYVDIVPPSKVREFLKVINPSKKRMTDSFVKGMPTNPGTVRGIARVVLSSKDFHKVNRGDILVAPMTSVDYVPIMEKAAAFVTNEGGLTSHASIVSREMNKPCVIGTKTATQVFKDGDMVEVDAVKGVVRKL